MLIELVQYYSAPYVPTLYSSILTTTLHAGSLYNKVTHHVGAVGRSRGDFSTGFLAAPTGQVPPRSTKTPRPFGDSDCSVQFKRWPHHHYRAWVVPGPSASTLCGVYIVVVLVLSLFFVRALYHCAVALHCFGILFRIAFNSCSLWVAGH